MKAFWFGALFLASAALADYAAEIGTACGDFPKLGYGTDDLEKFLYADPQNPPTLEKTLENLPKELRSYYTLMRKTGSQHSASDSAPRAILYGPDASFMVAFDATSNFIETIQFNFDKNEWEFRRYNYPLGKTPPEVNPSECMDCHRNQLRPNWDPYNFWGGAYGEDEDKLKSYEKEALRKFKEANVGKGRYAILEDLENFMNKDPDTRGKLEFPNSGLSEKASALNFRRIYSKIRQTPQYEKYRFSLLATLAGCGDAEALLPKSARRLHEPYANYVARIQKYDNDGQHSLGELKEEEKKMLASFLYLFEGRGISTSDWPLTIKKGIPGYSTGLLGLRRLLCLMKDDPSLVAKFPEVAAFAQNPDDATWEALQAACPRMERAAKRAFRPGSRRYGWPRRRDLRPSRSPSRGRPGH